MEIVANIVLKRADGTSILDADAPLVSDNISQYYVEPNRIKESITRIEKLGFVVSSQDDTTLSVTGPAKLFIELFGIDDPSVSSTADIHATIIPVELRDLIADVFIPERPILF